MPILNDIDRATRVQLLDAQYELWKRKARKDLLTYTQGMHEEFETSRMHKIYYHILNEFAWGRIKKLIVSMPPQHGKSSGSSRMLPSFMLGINPDLAILIGGYSAGHTADFGRDVDNIIDSQEYNDLFPDTRLAGSRFLSFDEKMESGKKVRRAILKEIVGHRGSLRLSGRQTPLTGKKIDVSILDDVYRDAMEANSPTIRESAWEWYTKVVRARLHNDSQELIVFTRWHEDDLIGRLERKGKNSKAEFDIAEPVVEIKSIEEIKDLPPNAWVKINFQALKEGDPTPLDPREHGEALWEERHSRKKLMADRILDEKAFSCLYQGEPDSQEGRLYQPFATYQDPSDYGVFEGKGSYTDVADAGNDYLATFFYDRYRSTTEFKDGKPMIYLLVTDILYTQEPIEITGDMMPMMLKRNATQYSYIESNAGGRAFCIIVKGKHRRCRYVTFHQSGNKESRVKTNAGLVNLHVIMPYGWDKLFPLAYDHLTKFKREFKSNTFDDIADAITGVVEAEITRTIGGATGGLQTAN